MHQDPDAPECPISDDPESLSTPQLLRRARAATGLSAQEVAILMHAPNLGQSVIDWETGKRGVPPKWVVPLANALKLRHRHLVARMARDYRDWLYEASGASRL